jgi:hypothetical protein
MLLGSPWESEVGSQERRSYIVNRLIGEVENSVLERPALWTEANF